MKKSILTLGKGLIKSEQKEIFGGGRIPFTTEGDPCYDVMEGQPTPEHCPCSSGAECASGICWSPAPGAITVCY